MKLKWFVFYASTTPSRYLWDLKYDLRVLSCYMIGNRELQNETQKYFDKLLDKAAFFCSQFRHQLNKFDNNITSSSWWEVNLHAESRVWLLEETQKVDATSDEEEPSFSSSIQCWASELLHSVSPLWVPGRKYTTSTTVTEKSPFWFN